MYGAWGKATASTNSRLFQLRALDWDVDGPFKNFPQITVYHPSNSDNGHAFANIGWTGWIGSITGNVFILKGVSFILAKFYFILLFIYLIFFVSSCSISDRILFKTNGHF